MSKEPYNFQFPFVNMLPEGVIDSNLMMNSMKMMNQAWQNFASLTPVSNDSDSATGELDKRIEELKTVESWLKLNLSMLENTINSLEIQKANLQTFQNFMTIMSEPMQSSSSESASDSSASPVEPKKEEPTPAAAETTPTEESKVEESKSEDSTNLVQDQALSWFNLLNDQFQTIMSSVAATTAATTASDNTETMTKSAAKKASPSKKTAAKKTAARKAPAKKSSARKTSAAKKATKKAAKKANS